MKALDTVPKHAHRAHFHSSQQVLLGNRYTSISETKLERQSWCHEQRRRMTFLKTLIILQGLSNSFKLCRLRRCHLCLQTPCKTCRARSWCHSLDLTMGDRLSHFINVINQYESQFVDVCIQMFVDVCSLYTLVFATDTVRRHGVVRQSRTCGFVVQLQRNKRAH